MNTTVAHKLLFHLVASKEAVFIKAGCQQNNSL